MADVLQSPNSNIMTSVVDRLVEIGLVASYYTDAEYKIKITFTEKGLRMLAPVHDLLANVGSLQNIQLAALAWIATTQLPKDDPRSSVLPPRPVITAKVIEHEGVQFALLPRSVHIDSPDVTIDMDRGKYVLTPRPAPELKTLADVARYMRETFPQGADFPDIERPPTPQERDLNLDR